MNSHLSNPFSTGGGGTTFEQLVGMYYLVSLLAADIPRGLNEGICYRVGFQQRWNDAILDDIVVTTRSSDASEHTLVLQVKHEITISTAASNNLFQRVISDCWETFEGRRGGFNPDIDRLGIAVGVYHSNIDEHLQRLLQWARTSISIEEFRRVKVGNFASNEMRNYLNDFEEILSRVAGKQISEKDLWQFLKCFVYIHFDIENDGSRDLSYLRNRAVDQLENRDEGEAGKLIDSLQVLVSDYAKTGGAIDAMILRQRLNQYELKDRIDCTRDLERLRNHSSRILSRINETIGQRIHLPRTKLVSETIEAVRKNSIVFILGEPGAGKSVLLRKIVDHFRQEGEVLVTSIDNISGSTLEEFTANLQIGHDFQFLLSAFRPAPFRCLFIDKLEQMLSDDQRSNVLYDLIHEVRKYNDEIPDNSEGAIWRIVATCRADQFYSLLPLLRRVIDLSTIKTLTVPPLDSSDVETIVEVFPSFQHLSKQQHVQDLLRNPFVLDFLTFPELKLVDLPKPEILTESWLVELYWMQIIRKSERSGGDNGNPDIREQAIVSLGELRLMSGRKPVPALELNPAIIRSLAQDRVIRSEDGRISFVHDTLDDWTVSRMLLSHWDQLSILLRKYEETMQLIKPIRLLALRHLELKQAADKWIELLSILRSDRQLAARWYQSILVAPLLSPMLDGILALIEPLLFDDDGILLRDFVRALRTIHTVPSQSILTLLQGTNTPQIEFEKMLAWSREPIAERWIPVWDLLFKHQDDLPIHALPEIAEAAYLWMKTANLPLRNNVGLFCLTILKKDFQNRLRDGYYTDEYVVYSSREGWIDDQVVRKLRESVLQGADRIPQEVKTLLYSLVETDERKFAELLFGRDSVLNWMPIAKHMPDVFIDITLKVFCDTSEIKVNEHDDFFSRRLLRENGIKHEHIWRFPTNYKDDTPFFYFLKMNPIYGIKLIVELVNFATQKWVEITRRADKVNPLPQILTLSAGKREFWGNHDVYNWCLEVPPHTVALALTSLRYWLDEYLRERNDEDPDRVFDIILSQSRSVALVAVCVLVAREDMNKRASALLPILSKSSFWQIDRHREIHMRMFGDGRGFHTFYQFSQVVLFTSKQEDREKLQLALRGFPTDVPFFFEEEKKDEDLINNRREHMEELAALAELENYSFKKHENGIAIEFSYPEHIENRHREERSSTEVLQKQAQLQAWAHSIDSGKQLENVSLEQAVTLAKELESSITSEDGKVTGIVAEICAAIVRHHYRWLKENGHLEWCRQKLFEAIRHKDKQSGTPDPITGLLHIVAKSLPSLVINDPSDDVAREVIWELIATSDPYPTDALVKSLFEGISPLWHVDPDYVWQSYNLLIAKAEAILANRNKAYVQKIDDEAEAEEQIELKAEVPKLNQLDIDFVYLLSPLITAFPKLSDLRQAQSDPRFLEFIDEAVVLNNTAHKHSHMTRESREHPLFQVPREWEEPIDDLLSDWVLHLPFDLARLHILDPMIKVWEEGSGALENLLDTLVLNTESSEYEERFTAIWKHTIPLIMQTDTVKNNPQGWRSDDLKNTYSCLILMTRYGIVEPWKDRDWNPCLNLTDEFSLWVERLAHYRDNFSILIRMLRNVGKTIRVPYGVNWLFEAFHRSENTDRLFDTSRDASALSQLLFDIWFENNGLRDDQPLYQRFTFLVDYLASKGDQVAVELQRKIQS